MKKRWSTPKLTHFTAAPDDYEALNNILIAQAGEMEILIQGQQERIRDLETENAELRIILAAIPYNPPTPEQLEEWNKKFDIKTIKLTIGKWD